MSAADESAFHAAMQADPVLRQQFEMWCRREEEEEEEASEPLSDPARAHFERLWGSVNPPQPVVTPPPFSLHEEQSVAPSFEDALPAAAFQEPRGHLSDWLRRLFNPRRTDDSGSEAAEPAATIDVPDSAALARAVAEAIRHARRRGGEAEIIAEAPSATRLRVTLAAAEWSSYTAALIAVSASGATVPPASARAHLTGLLSQIVDIRVLPPRR